MSIYDTIASRTLSRAQAILDSFNDNKTHYETLLANLAGDNPNADVLTARAVCQQKIDEASASVVSQSAKVASAASKLYANLSQEDKDAVDYMMANLTGNTCAELFRSDIAPSAIHARAQEGFASLSIDPLSLPQEARDSAYVFAETLLRQV